MKGVCMVKGVHSEGETFMVKGAYMARGHV